MAFKFYDRVRVAVASAPGTGAATLGAATNAFQSFTAAGASNGDTFPYLILDGNNWEIGVGTYSSSGPTVTRTTFTASSSGSPINFTANAIVMCAIRAEDVGAGTLAGDSDVSITSPTNGQVLTYSTSAGKWENASAGGGKGVLSPPVSTNFGAVTNLGSSTLTDRSTGAVPSLHVVPGTLDDQHLYCTLQAAPSGAFSLVVKVKGVAYGNEGGYCGAGPVLYNSGNGYLVYNWLTSSYQPQFYNAHCTSFSSISAGLGSNQMDGDFFQHIDYDGTNIKHGISRNGVDVVWASTETLASFLGAITHVGLGWSSSNGLQINFDFLHFFAGTEGSSGITP